MRTRNWGDDSSICIKLSAGASIALTFKGNLFDLTAAERNLIADLSNIIQKYKDTVVEPATNHQEQL